MTSLTEELRQKALDLGFVSVGISNPSMLHDLPYGPVRQIKELVTPADDMPSVRSVIIMVFHVWDDIFHTSLDSPEWRGFGLHSPDEQFESYFFGSAIMRNKAWEIVDFLRRRGFESKISFNIPLKTAAVKCGLGSQGKNTLVVTPTYGPRVNLVSVLTEAELDIDRPFEKDLCGDCQLCLTACPTKALEPYNLNIEHCMTYSAETPCTDDVPKHVREMERKLVRRPTSNTYIECSKCMDVCPVGKHA
ncbi:MAG: 4Fe-4S double cluster binding domain-containing protein [Candidatus Thorarchaeota archaeon]|jgi:epoxyqueuosine reductase QueG